MVLGRKLLTFVGCSAARIGMVTCIRVGAGTFYTMLHEGKTCRGLNEPVLVRSNAYCVVGERP